MLLLQLASHPAAGSIPGDWPASTTTKRDEKKARSLGYISSDEWNVILPVYEIQLWQLTPNSILHLAIFITLCEAFLGIEPHFGLWKKIFFVKRYNSSGGSFVIDGVGFVARKEVNYFNFPMRESVQGWRLKWFYIRDSSTAEFQLPRFSDVLEAKPKQSWKNTISPDEKPSVDRLFDRFLRIKEADGQTMTCTEVAAVFLKRRVQPIMVRAHPMWLYSGPKDETRINAAELSEKELLDEVRRLTHFSQEDSIPLTSSHLPFDADHPPTENPIDPDYLQDFGTADRRLCRQHKGGYQASSVSAVFGFRNPSKEIFSNWTKSSPGSYFCTLPKTEEGRKWGHEAPHHRAARPWPRRPRVWGPRVAPTLPFRLLKASAKPESPIRKTFQSRRRIPSRGIQEIASGTLERGFISGGLYTAMVASGVMSE
ncbi:hypothetical protein QYE76_005100 [Lolium multiflorum]|uniref:Transposase (putative) gypsy type domain-containing protein n=1 Tax=Lolium multiflorum TaxID=4521 RepID=A0AAD8RSC7_LOLMU|nr:hypothetical protein QYE76_005100 [Lolium multiflorum]